MRWIVLPILVVSAVALGGCMKPGVKVEGHIGVVDPQRLLDETNAGKKAKDNLLAYSKNRQALIELEAKELRRMQEDAERQRSVLSPAAFRERGEQFQRRMQEYQQKVSELNREVQEKQKDVLDGFREKVDVMVTRISKRLGLQVVLDKSKGGPTLYSEDTLDITNYVIEEIDREYP
ncbi:MAG TPA: OmpH family outer membrane protein [Nitrospira sp.]|nr:OmpH family outer membrane protein [Nitrospira sp.]